MSESGKWIQDAIKPQNKGKLRAKLKVAEGKNIPKAKLAIKPNDSTKTKRQKNLAKTLRGFD